MRTGIQWNKFQKLNIIGSEYSGIGQLDNPECVAANFASPNAITGFGSGAISSTMVR